MYGGHPGKGPGQHAQPAGLTVATGRWVSAQAQRPGGRAAGRAQGGHAGYPVQPEDVTRPLFFSRSAVFDSLSPRGLLHVRVPCPSPSPQM